MTTVARLQRTITDYRTRLMWHEAGATTALESAYQGVLTAIQPQLDRLYENITQKLDAGEKIPASWLYDRHRLENLSLLVQHQVDQFGATALMYTRQLQHLGIDLGSQAALSLLDASKPDGVHWAFGTPSTTALERLVGATQAGSPLADLFAGFGREAAKLVSQALISGVAQGNGPREIAPQVKQALGVSRARALTITRTEAIRAYRGANQETFRANDDVVKGWRWTCAKQARTCAACLAMDGTLHALDEEMGSHPNCRCAPIPITKSWDEILKPLGIDASSIPDSRPQMETGAEWLEKQPERIQRAILGAKYPGWKAGDFTLKDLVKRTFDPDWGASIQEKSLAQLDAEQATRQERRLTELAQSLMAKYPQTTFDFTGLDPATMEVAADQIDHLFEAYPQVAESIPYVGSGLKDAPPGYEPDWVEYRRALAFVRSSKSAPESYAPMFFNPRYYGNPAYLQETLERMKKSGWNPMNPTIESTITHEFGHVVNFFLEQNGQEHSMFGYINRDGVGEIAHIVKMFRTIHKRLGETVSRYAATGGPYEAFAEAFSAIHFQDEAQWNEYTRKLKGLLDLLLPGGSAATWQSPPRAKLTQAQFKHWLAFYKQFLTEDEEEEQ